MLQNLCGGVRISCKQAILLSIYVQAARDGEVYTLSPNWASFKLHILPMRSFWPCPSLNDQSVPIFDIILILVE